MAIEWSFLLTFNDSELPKFVIAAFYKLDFVHLLQHQYGVLVWAYSDEVEEEEGSLYGTPVCCIICGGDHSSTSG